MKIKFLLFFILIVISNINIYSQRQKFNLKNLDNISVGISDHENLMSSELKQKIITEIKVKLMSMSLKVTSPEKAQASMIFTLNAIKSQFSEHRILILLDIFENVVTPRDASIKTIASTYSDYVFYTDKDIQNSIFYMIMNSMIIKFIENYLKD